MGEPPKKIALFGLFGSGNLGNDGSLEAMLDFLRVARPDAELACICADPGKVERDFRIRSMRIGGDHPNNRFLRALEGFMPTRKALQGLHALKSARKFDAIIVPGTGILDDFGDRFWGMPASLFGWCLAAKLSGTRIAFVSIGAGPINHSVSRWLMKQAARMAHYRSYRDTVSKEFMESVGFDTARDPIYPDIAFRLPSPRGPGPAVGETLTVGVGVMAYYGWRGDSTRGAAIHRSYLEKLARFVLWLLDRGHRVRILTGETTDQRAVDALLEILASSRPDYPHERIVSEPVNSLHDLMRQIADTHVVVATRFHNIVCALKLNRPAISIGYAKKNDVLMAEMGVGEFCQHIEKLDVDLLIEQFSKVVSDRGRYERRIEAMNAEYGQRLARQERVLVEQIL